MARRLAAAALALAVLLAGCGGVDVGQLGDSTPGDDAGTAQPTATPGPTPTESPTPTATEAWERPEPPNRPLDIVDEGRIHEVRFVNTVPASDGDGYADFDLAVRANTSMENIDPPEHGTPEGEPYFLVYVEGELVERTGIVVHDRDWNGTVRVRRAALDRFEPGTLEVHVALMDKDTQYDDRYGVWNTTVEYDPD